MSEPIRPYLAKPQIPKTFGILNLIFGTILLLTGLCSVAFYAMLPTFKDAITKTQAGIDASFEQRVKELEAREKASTDATEKADLRQQIDSLKNSPRPQITGSMDIVQEPTVMLMSWIGMIMHILISIGMIVSGIGLIRLTEFGRKSGLAVAGGSLAWLWIGVILNIIFVLPVTKAATLKQLETTEAQLQKGNNAGAPGAAASMQIARAMVDLGPVIAVGSAVFYSIYPLLCLWLLNSRGAREACLPEEPPVLTEYGRRDL